MYATDNDVLDNDQEPILIDENKRTVVGVAAADGVLLCCIASVILEE